MTILGAEFPHGAPTYRCHLQANAFGLLLLWALLFTLWIEITVPGQVLCLQKEPAQAGHSLEAKISSIT